MFPHTTTNLVCFWRSLNWRIWKSKTMPNKAKSKRTIVLLELFRKTCADERFWNQWRSSDLWIDIINKLYPDARPFNFKKKDLNMAISRDAQLKHCDIVFGSLTNSFGIYSQSHRKNSVRTVAYYATAPNTEVKKLPRDSKWWDQICERTPTTRSIGVKKDYSENVLKIILDKNELNKKENNNRG